MAPMALQWTREKFETRRWKDGSVAQSWTGMMRISQKPRQKLGVGFTMTTSDAPRSSVLETITAPFRKNRRSSASTRQYEKSAVNGDAQSSEKQQMIGLAEDSPTGDPEKLDSDGDEYADKDRIKEAHQDGLDRQRYMRVIPGRCPAELSELQSTNRISLSMGESRRAGAEQTPWRVLSRRLVCRPAGRKFDHARDARSLFAVPLEEEETSQLMSFMDESRVLQQHTQHSQVMSQEWMDENIPDFAEPGMPAWYKVQGPKDGRFWLFSGEKRAYAWNYFLFVIMRNPFIPLVTRLTVLAFVLAALGLGVNIYKESNDLNNNTSALAGVQIPANSDTDVICKQQTSTYMAFIVDSVAVLYILYITWDEYFSKPLGLRQTKDKIRLLFLDLLFVIFSAANLSLAFNTLTDQQWSCYSGSPNQDNTNNAEAARSTCVQNDKLCQRQRGLCAVLLLAEIAWVAAFAISIFRVIDTALGVAKGRTRELGTMNPPNLLRTLPHRMLQSHVPAEGSAGGIMSELPAEHEGGSRSESSSGASGRPLAGTLRTCQACSSLKIRCIRSKTQGPCDRLTPQTQRCLRLGKDCQRAQARRRQPGVQKDDRAATRDASHDSTSASKTLSGIAFRPTEDEPGDITDVFDVGLVTSELAESLVTRFKTNMTPHFPFVVLGAHELAGTLRRRKPFLLLAILSVASYDDMPLQRALGRLLKQALARMLTEGQILNVEILQGLLVYLAWSQYAPRPGCFTQHLQLAISIIIDLRLDQGPGRRAYQSRMGVSKIKNTPQGRDEERAVAGCFFLSSNVAVLLQKTPSFPYSAYSEQCCKCMTESLECSTDRFVYPIVSLQHLADKIYALSIQYAEGTNPPTATFDDNVAQLRSALDAFKSSLPFTIYEYGTLAMQFHTVELFLYQVGVCGTGSESNTMPHLPWSPWRLEMLGSGLVAAKSLLGFYHSLPLRSEMAFTNIQYLQLGYGLMFGTRLAVAASSPAVCHQTQQLRDILDMSDVLRDTSARIGSVRSELFYENGERDAFHHLQHRIQHIKQWLEDQVRAQALPNQHGKGRNPMQSAQESALPDIIHETDSANEFMIHDSMYADDLEIGPNTYEQLLGDPFGFGHQTHFSANQ
ncbi:hypothetical protein FH972_021391 [Carpinus fangiana]|uniref:Zn(2)-C6 fungal-type domain-containing protein n=1 Tax=Carpinus fangiana TaxID=176857 RepID=A0A5N6KRD6_9ROSI|nr:hypothetical protein FH972_021391 [Carpinus fangiana]